jgi:hypothetical protein
MLVAFVEASSSSWLNLGREEELVEPVVFVVIVVVVVVAVLIVVIDVGVAAGTVVEVAAVAVLDVGAVVGDVFFVAHVVVVLKNVIAVVVVLVLPEVLWQSFVGSFVVASWV